MRINSINLNYLKVFESVYRTGSMTMAAQELYLTQSGVSQHIKSLEDNLETALFERVNKQLRPTRKGHKFYEKTSGALLDIENVIFEVCEKKQQVEGSLAIGMPTQFGVDKLLPKLSAVGRKYPLLHLNIYMGFTLELIELLLDGDLDFAFVDNFIKNSKIKTQKVLDESLELCISDRYLKEKKIKSLKATKSLLKDLDFIAYEKGAPILRNWLAHHLNQRNTALNIRAQVRNTQGLSQMVINDLGAGILPDHFITELKSHGHKLHIFKTHHKSLTNSINLASLRQKEDDYVMNTVISELMKP